MESYYGTPLYMSPQIHNKNRYTSKSDVFSFGVLMFQIYFGCNPWNHQPGPDEDSKKDQIMVLRNDIEQRPIDKVLGSDKIQKILKQKQKDFPEQDLLD